MPRTVTASAIRDRWSALCGFDIDDVIDADAAAFVQYINRNIRFAYTKTYWPDTLSITSKTADANEFIDLSADTTIGTILNVYSANPFTSNSEKKVPFQIVKDGLYVDGYASTEVFIEHQDYEPTVTSALTEEVLFIFQEYLAQACYADWLAAEGQHAKSELERNKAEEILQRELENLELRSSQARGPSVKTYFPPS